MFSIVGEGLRALPKGFGYKLREGTETLPYYNLHIKSNIKDFYMQKEVSYFVRYELTAYTVLPFHKRRDQPFVDTPVRVTYSPFLSV